MPVITVPRAAELLLDSAIIAFPTETVYGLGAIASDQKAVDQIYIAKSRPRDNPLICHFTDIDHILAYVNFPNQYVYELLQKFGPGPISLLLPIKESAKTILQPALSGSNNIVCRIPNNSLTLGLIKLIGLPLAGPSANISGRPSSTSASMVLDQLGDRIAGVIDGGDCQIGLESTILDCTQPDKVTILRPGSIGDLELTEFLFDLGIQIQSFDNKYGSNLTIPGNKYPHYSPITPIKHIQDLDEIPVVNQKVLILAAQETLEKIGKINDIGFKLQIINLGSKFILSDVAHNLYSNLSLVDDFGLDIAYLIDEDWGDQSIGKAISNRLCKV